MKRYYFILSLIIFSCSSGQEKEDYENAVILETIVLPKIINETSGLEILDNQLTIACGENAIQILELQKEGKKNMNVSEFLKGNKLKIGSNVS